MTPFNDAEKVARVSAVAVKWAVSAEAAGVAGRLQLAEKVAGVSAAAVEWAVSAQAAEVRGRLLLVAKSQGVSREAVTWALQAEASAVEGRLLLVAKFEPCSVGVSECRAVSGLNQYVLTESVSMVPSSSLTAAVLAFDFRVGRSEPGAPALLTATLCPDRGTAEPSCTPLRVPRAAQAPVHHMPHPPSPGGPTSPPRARAYPSAALLPSRVRCTRFSSGLATPRV